MSYIPFNDEVSSLVAHGPEVLWVSGGGTRNGSTLGLGWFTRFTNAQHVTGTNTEQVGRKRGQRKRCCPVVQRITQNSIQDNHASDFDEIWSDYV